MAANHHHDKLKAIMYMRSLTASNGISMADPSQASQKTEEHGH